MKDSFQPAGDIEQTPLWEICRRLVGFDTVPTSSNVPCAEYLADLLDDVGWSTCLHRDRFLGADKASLVAWMGPEEEGGLLLSGHMDVVPFQSQPGWTRDALVLGRDDDRIYGRGVADMKGFLAQCVVAARTLDRAHLRRPLVFVFTCDEEVGCHGSGRLAPHLREITGNIPLPIEAVIGEPTDFRILIAHKGHVRFTVRVEGRGGHSSRPDLGTSAIAAAAEAIRELGELEWDLLDRATPTGRTLFPDFPAVPLNLGTIQGGTAINMIPECCEFTVGMRPLPDDDPLVYIGEATQRMIDAVGRRHPQARLTVADVEITPAMLSPSDGRVVSALQKLMGGSVGGGASFATDGGQLAAIGIRSVICGPGELEQAHQPDESLPILNLFRGLELVEGLIQLTCFN